MSSDVQGPFQTSFNQRNQRQSFFSKISKPKLPPPTAFDSQRRSHGRSSSLGSFVSRILPTRREERGHTLRQSFQNDGIHNATDLVFGIPEPGVPGTPPGGSVPGRGIVRRPVGSGPYVAGRTSSGRPAPNTGRQGLEGASEGGAGTLGKIAGLRRAFGMRKGSEVMVSSNLKPPPIVTQQEIPRPSFSVLRDPLLDADAELSKAQRMYEDKKVRRANRRSVRESGDFLGIQGANPRTGYWDPSTGTSSSDPSQMSEATRKRIDREARDLKEKRRKWEEAQVKLEAELKRVQSLREKKRKEKVDQKKYEVSARQRRHGKWKVGDNEWSSVAEPDLSPIVQSLVGTPMRETPPQPDRLFPMPTAANPNPYIEEHIDDQDYFNIRGVTSPIPPQSHHIPRKAVGSPAIRSQSAGSTLQNILLNTPVRASPPTVRPMRSPVTPKRASRSPSPRAKYSRNESPEFRMPIQGDAARMMIPPALISRPRPHSSVAQTRSNRNSFLDKTSLPMKGTKNIREAIATSYQSASTPHSVPRRPLAPSPKSGSPSSRITVPLDHFPPICLKDPVTARIPLNAPPNPNVVWAPPTVRETEIIDRISPTATHTTTTTGQGPPRRPLTQFDGPMETKQPRKVSNMENESHQRHLQNVTPKNMYQIPPADIVTLSEHQLTPTKNRTARLCQTNSPEREERLKSTPTSTSTSPIQGAYHAALQAFQNSRHKAAIKKSRGQNGELLTPPKLRPMQAPNMMGRDFMAVPGGLAEIGSCYENKQRIDRESILYQKSAVIPTNPSSLSPRSPRGRRPDGLVVWHQSPTVERKISGSGYHLQMHSSRGLSPVRVHASPTQLGHTKRQLRGEIVSEGKGVRDHQGRLLPNNKAPRPGILTPHMAKQTLIRILQTAWWFVEPIFEPSSGIRKRWDKRRLTWRDLLLVFAAATFGMGLFMLVLIFARVVGLGFQAVGGFTSLLRIIIGV